MTTDAPKPTVRAKRPPAAQGSRIVATGAAVGAGLALVGVMASAAEAAPAPPPEQLVIVVDGSAISGAGAVADSDARGQLARVVTVPESVQVREPVTESGGS